MEMNTRLQVEHPVSEMITGVDLVEWQLRVAAGEALPLRQETSRSRARDRGAHLRREPGQGVSAVDRPAQHLRTPHAADSIDASGARRFGVREGDSITPYYDPMIAKLVCWGESREIALARMSAALARVRSRRPGDQHRFPRRVVRSRAFAPPTSTPG
jgi:3-methylcrotonyl-CoA carboxylase alpha subunit